MADRNPPPARIVIAGGIGWSNLGPCLDNMFLCLREFICRCVQEEVGTLPRGKAQQNSNLILALMGVCSGCEGAEDNRDVVAPCDRIHRSFVGRLYEEFGTGQGPCQTGTGSDGRASSRTRLTDFCFHPSCRLAFIAQRPSLLSLQRHLDRLRLRQTLLTAPTIPSIPSKALHATTTRSSTIYPSLLNTPSSLS